MKSYRGGAAGEWARGTMRFGIAPLTPDSDGMFRAAAILEDILVQRTWH